MKIIERNRCIKMTAENKRDSLNLLKFLDAMAGGNDPDRTAVIQEKEKELELLESKNPTIQQSENLNQ